MRFLEKIQHGLGTAAQTAASLLKIALMSRRPSRRCRDVRDTVIVMGNGPSLKEAMADHMDVLMSYPRLAVNFYALAPEFDLLKPDYYILADRVFFAKDKMEKVSRLWDALTAVGWRMTLFVPATARGMEEVRGLPGNVNVRYYNLTPAEGYSRLMHRLYDSGLGMPRPRNVLIPSIMCLIREGFKRIILIGADHNWSKTLWVTDRNIVVSVQPHFYKDDDEELRRCEEMHKNIHIHQMYENFAVAFRSYFNVKGYADRKGVEILNATPGSFIDAFERVRLSDLRREMN